MEFQKKQKNFYFFYVLFTLLPISETNKKHCQHINWHGNRGDTREEAKLLKHYEKKCFKIFSSNVKNRKSLKFYGGKYRTSRIQNLEYRIFF